MVEHVLAKDETGVRFSLAALRQAQHKHKILSFTKALQHKDFIEIHAKGRINVDNYVGTVYKGHSLELSFSTHFVKISL